MLIRPASIADYDAVWAIIEPVIRAGETYALDRDLSRADALAYWLGADREAFLLEKDGRVLGTYYQRPNQLGGGRHVCNCGYMTVESAKGQGIARAMFDHSVEHAKSRGYLAMQFNFVVSTNQRAVRLWLSLGFDVVGRLPGVFQHPSAGRVDALVMFRSLQEPV